MTTTWTQVLKAVGTSWTQVPKASQMAPTFTGGEPIGLLMALTYTIVTQPSAWTKINKASTTAWSKIPKAT